MSNSPLVNFTLISPHRRTRTAVIDRITIHHAAGVSTAEGIGSAFQGQRVASANYGIGNDGKIGQYVPEEMRAITSSNTMNDNRAVTIEVSNSEARYPWPVSDAAYRALIDLCVDICLRNNIDKLVYTGDTNGNLTRHNMFAATACPGPYLQERFPQIADDVNQRLEDERMTGKDILAKLTDEEAWMLVEKANRHASTLKPSEYAESACAKAVTSGLFSDGDHNGMLDNPLAYVKRQEFAVVLDRMGELGGDDAR